MPTEIRNLAHLGCLGGYENSTMSLTKLNGASFRFHLVSMPPLGCVKSGYHTTLGPTATLRVMCMHLDQERSNTTQSSPSHFSVPQRWPAPATASPRSRGSWHREQEGIPFFQDFKISKIGNFCWKISLVFSKISRFSEKSSFGTQILKKSPAGD